jgi:hypothetical protein
MTTSEPEKTQLVVVELRTKLGASYVFPDVSHAVLNTLLNGFMPSAQVAITNVSGACLVIPTRIVESIHVDGEEKWHR